MNILGIGIGLFAFSVCLWLYDKLSDAWYRKHPPDPITIDLSKFQEPEPPPVTMWDLVDPHLQQRHLQQMENQRALFPDPDGELLTGEEAKQITPYNPGPATPKEWRFGASGITYFTP
ncbi:MAG: hypothetical protein JWO82_3762 [Akkermansiaceae bacterium]|nr:hypothetical protein [Akkermansiaceae bacterium]